MKSSIRKQESIRDSQKREPSEETKDQESLKQEPNQEQTEIMKKIQNKLRLRKRSLNTQTNDRVSTTPPVSMGELNSKLEPKRTLQSYNTTIDIDEEINAAFYGSIEIRNKLIKENVNEEPILAELAKSTTFILCQLNKGKTMEEILIQKISTTIEACKLRERIEKKEKNIMAMMDERLKKLSMF